MKCTAQPQILYEVAFSLLPSLPIAVQRGGGGILRGCLEIDFGAEVDVAGTHVASLCVCLTGLWP